MLVGREGVGHIMERPQVNARLSPELDAEFNCWVEELGVTRGKLAWNIVTEALAARREGRATFSRPEQPSPVDLQHLTARINTMVTELDRVLRQNGKREAELARSAKADAVGISEARTAIVTQLTTEFRQAYNTGQVGFDTVATALITALTASPAFGALLPVLQRIERDPRVDAIGQRQLEQGALLKAHTAAIASWVKQPRKQVSYTVWEKHWSGRRVGAILLSLWVTSVVTFFVIAMVLPRSWLAVHSANTLLGGGDQAVCALVDYRMATDRCRVEIDGQAMKVVVKAEPRSEARKP